MARGRYKLKRDLAAEQGQIQSAAKKRGLWGSIGGTLLGGLAIAVTGGAASPVVAGLMAGGGKYIGGHLGNLLAGKTKGGRLKGGKFFQGEREALASQIKENIGAQAAKAGLTAGMAKLPGAALKFGKEGFSATVQKASGQVGKAEEAASLYAPGEGGLGKLLDFRGSFVGKGLGKMQAARATRETADAAREWEAIQGGMAPTYGGFDIDKVLQQGKAQRVKDAVEMERSVSAFDRTLAAPRSTAAHHLQNIKKVDPSKLAGASEAQAKAISEGLVPPEYGLPKGVTWGETAIDPGRSDLSYAIPGQKGGLPGHQGALSQYPHYAGDVPDLMDMYEDELSLARVERMEAAKSADPIRGMQRLKGVEEQDYLMDIERADMPTEAIPTDMPLGKGLNPIERKYYDRVNQMEGGGYSTSVRGGLPEEYGRGYISRETGDIVRPPASPNVPLQDYPMEGLEDFNLPTTMNEVSVSGQGGPGFSEFDEASWKEGRKTLSNIDFGLADEQIPWQKRFFPKKRGFESRW